MRSTRASASPPASTRSPPTTAARKSPACWRAPRSPRRRGRPRNGCSGPRRRDSLVSRTRCRALGAAPQSRDPSSGAPDQRPAARALRSIRERARRRLFSRRSSSYSMAMAKAAKAKSLPEVAGLTKAQAKVEHKRLALELEAHDRRYYQDDAPSVTDAEYDALRQRFNAIEARFPELVTSSSPSQKIGAAPSGRFKKVRHAVPMLSLDNAFAEADVVDFVGRIQRFLKLPDDKVDFSAEPKIDGRSEERRVGKECRSRW